VAITFRDATALLRSLGCRATLTKQLWGETQRLVKQIAIGIQVVVNSDRVPWRFVRIDLFCELRKLDTCKFVVKADRLALFAPSMLDDKADFIAGYPCCKVLPKPQAVFLESTERWIRLFPKR
jgi:hypothetical protein